VAVLFFAVVIAVFSAFSQAGPSSRASWTMPNFGIVEIYGVIESSENVMQQLRSYVKDEMVQGILVRIDSGGGVVGPIQEIYAELRKAAEVKPVVASLGSTAASGGYYIAAACDEIVANPGTLTGSIGVIMDFVSLEGAFDKLGIKSEVIVSGRNKAAGHYSAALTDEQRQMLESTVMDVHEQFVEAVAQGRNMKKEQVAEWAEGRIFSGRQALATGLVDRLGTFYDAVDLLKERLEISEEVNLIRPKLTHESLFDFFLDELTGRLRQSLAGEAADREGEHLYYR
jgi:protease-4